MGNQTSGPAGLEPGTLRRIDHVAMAVRDAGAASEMLSSMLGLTVVCDEFLADVGARLCYLGTTVDFGLDTVLQLVQPTVPGPLSDFLDERGEGLHHVCFAVNDAADTLAAAEPGGGGSVFVGGRGRRCAFLSVQPCGLLVELIEDHPAVVSDRPVRS